MASIQEKVYEIIQKKELKVALECLKQLEERSIPLKSFL